MNDYFDKKKDTEDESKYSEEYINHKKLLLNMIENLESFSDESDYKKTDFPAKSVFLKFGFAAILLVILFFSIFYRNRIGYLPVSYVIEKGDFFINKKKGVAGKENSLKKNDILLTGLQTEAVILSGRSKIKLAEMSEIKIIETRKNDRININRFELLKGGIYCEANLSDKKSIFEVVTKTADFNVKGTKYSIEIKDNEIILQVDEGTVVVDNFIKSIKKEDGIFNERPDKSDILKINVEKDERLIIKDNDIEKINYELIGIREEYRKYPDAGILNEKLDIIESKIAGFKQKKDDRKELINTGITDSNNEKNILETESFEVKRLYKFSNDVLAEAYTGVSKAQSDIIISSGNNKTYYSINSRTGKLNWIFKDHRIKRITVNAYGSGGGILIGSPDILMLLSNNGKIISTFDLQKGIYYWPDFIESEGKIYIPTTQNILFYYKNGINKLDNMADSDGQLYISKYENRLYCYNMNTLNLLEYDLLENKTTDTIGRLESRSFMSPLIIDGYVYMADIAGKIYKFSLSKSGSPSILSVGNGIVNMTHDKGKLYFIAGDGYFYSVDYAAFKSYVKITEVDMNPDPDKYLTKKPLFVNGEIYFLSDTGKIFYYNTKNLSWKFITVNENDENNPLIGSPVSINGNIYFIDIKSNAYVLSRKGMNDQ